MTSLTTEQVARMRRATGIRLIKKMSAEELNETFTRQFDEIQRLREALKTVLDELKDNRTDEYTINAIAEILDSEQ